MFREKLYKAQDYKILCYLKNCILGEGTGITVTSAVPGAVLSALSALSLPLGSKTHKA